MPGDIFGNTPVPKWIDPGERLLQWHQQATADAAQQTQSEAVRGQLQLESAKVALQQQQFGLAQKMTAAQLAAQSQAYQQNGLKLKEATEGTQQFNDMVQAAGGNDDALYNSQPPTNPIALQKWTDGKNAWSQSTAQQAVTNLKTDFNTRLSSQGNLDGLGFARVNDALQNGGKNPDGTPKASVLELLGNEEQRVITAKQQREVQLKTAPIEIKNTGAAAVANIKADAQKYTADETAAWRNNWSKSLNDSRVQTANIRSATELAISKNTLAAAADKSLDQADAETLKAQLEMIAKSTDPNDTPQMKNAEMLTAARSFALMHVRIHAAAPADANAAPANPQGSAPASNTTIRIAPDGRKVIYDSTTKQPIGYAE